MCHCGIIGQLQTKSDALAQITDLDCCPKCVFWPFVYVLNVLYCSFTAVKKEPPLYGRFLNVIA